MINWPKKSLCRECYSRKRDVVDDWCPNCLAERDRHIDLYINAVLALPHNRTDQDVSELVNTAIANIQALPPGGVIPALKDAWWQIVRRRE